MLVGTKELHGVKIRALDGEIGRIDEILFDDVSWTLRYLIVATGSWLFDRKVLISPVSIGQLDWDERTLNVNLTCDQIKDSPDVDTDKPVSRQWESDYLKYYALPYYWSGSTVWAQPSYLAPVVGQFPMDVDPFPNKDSEGPQDHADHHLRSTKAVTGYGISATDGHIGHVQDFIVDDKAWQIRYLAVDTRDWWPGKKVLLPLDWISGIAWEEKTVAIKHTREQVKEVPEWDTRESITCETEEALYQYFNNHRDLVSGSLTEKTNNQ